MEIVTVNPDVLYTQRKRFNTVHNPYNIDLWKEVRKRWLVLGVLGALLLAVVSPRVGAPGGPLYPEYLCPCAAALIYGCAGARAARPGARALRVAGVAALHAHVAAPALCACAVTVFGAALHASVVSGALVSSVGSGCAWLSLALARGRSAAPAAAACYAASLLATPLSALLLCGRASIPPLGEVLGTCARAVVPFLCGVWSRGWRGWRGAGGGARGAALALVYAECCARLHAAAGALPPADLLAIIMLEVCWVAASACACAAYARWCGARAARLIALCAVPKALDQGWGGAAACRLGGGGGGGGGAMLAGAVAAPAQALLLAALAHHTDSDDDC